MTGLGDIVGSLCDLAEQVLYDWPWTTYLFVCIVTRTRHHPFKQRQCSRVLRASSQNISLSMIHRVQIVCIPERMGVDECMEAENNSE